jgi:hypothetical protein
LYRRAALNIFKFIFRFLISAFVCTGILCVGVIGILAIRALTYDPDAPGWKPAEYHYTGSITGKD